MNSSGTPNIAIREATRGDADAVARLVCELFAELAKPEDSGYSVAVVADLATALLRRERIWAVLASDGDRPVGVITLNECAALYAGGEFGEICELYVARRFRSGAVGKRLIEAAVAFARQRGWTRLEVGAPELPKWQRSVDFYRRCGFGPVGPRLKLELRT